jgi:hypothetical protein
MIRKTKRWSAAFVVVVLVAACYPVTPNDSLQFHVPTDGATVQQPQVLSVDGSGVTRVTFQVDGEVVQDATTSPFQWTLDPADYTGQREITVVATQDGVDHSMTVTVNCETGGGGGGGSTPLAFLLPADGTTINAPTTLAVQGSDVTSVQFRLDGTLARDDSSVPFAWVLNPASVSQGTHQITVDANTASGKETRTVSLKTVPPADEPAPPADVITAIEALSPGQWYEIPNTHLADVAASPSPGGGIGGIIGAWSSGAYDTKRNRLIVFGGGHGDYAGNEIYAFSMVSFTWKRLNNPSAFPPGDEDNASFSQQHPDGAPISRHTYDYLEYVPSVDRFFVGGGSGLWKDGQHEDDHTYLFNFDTLEWSSNYDKDPSYGIGSTSALGPDGRVWQHGAYGDTAVLAAFDATTGKWTRYAFYNAWIGYGRTAEIDPIANKYVLIGEGDLRIWDLNNPNQQHTQPSTTGAAPPTLHHPGVAWDPNAKKIVVWQGGAMVYSLDVPTLHWTSTTSTGVNTTPPDAASAGTNGRWRYVPSLKLFVVVNSVNGNVFVYKNS